MGVLLLNTFLAIIIAYFVQLVLHEFGHYFAGLLTGWKLISIQVSHVAIVKENLHFKLKWTNYRRSQCIMYPRNLNSDAIIYSLGGCIMNAFITLLGAVVIFINHSILYILIYTGSLIVWGITFLIMNGIPMINTICNDMACCFLLWENEQTMICHNAQMLIARELVGEKSYGKISDELLCHKINTVDNDILVYHAILEYYHYLEREDYKKCNEILVKINVCTKVSQGVKNIVCVEKLYHDIITSFTLNSKTMLDINKYDGDIERYIDSRTTSGDVHTVRIKAVYHAFYNYIQDDLNNAYKCLYSALQELNKTETLYTGDKIFCENQISMTLNLLKRHI